MSFNKVWFIVPNYIRKLPGMTLAYLDIYETIFEFFNHGKPCFLSNQTIMERTGIKNDRTIRDGLAFFEKANVLKRYSKNNKRYIVQVTQVEIPDEPVDNPTKNSTNCDSGGSRDPGGRVCSTGGGGSTDPHNINNINNKINKSFSYREDQKKHIHVDNHEERRFENAKKHSWVNKNETKSSVQFWGPGHPNYDHVHSYKKSQYRLDYEKNHT